MTTTPRLLAPCLAALLITGCSGPQLSRSLGLTRDSPDEFTVTTRAPLAIPDDDTLVPPQPGAPRPQEPAAQLAAEADLSPNLELNNRTGSETPGQEALIAAAGPPAPDGIRQAIDNDATKLNAQGGIGTTLAFWKKTPLPGKVIDPVKEAARLRDEGTKVGTGSVPLSN